jgi:hypothetical protein
MILLFYIAVCFCAYWLIFIKTEEGAEPMKERRKEKENKREKDSVKIKAEKEHIRAAAFNEGFLTGYNIAVKELSNKTIQP